MQIYFLTAKVFLDREVFLKICSVSACLLSLSGCFGGFSSALKQAEQNGLHTQTLQTDLFNLQSFASPVQRSESVTIVFEGDGLAYRFGKVSPDPTPQTATGLQIALAAYKTTSFNQALVYIARPCQYVQDRISGQPHLCDNPIYWTHHRYAPYVVTQMTQAVEQVMRDYQTQKVQFVGYSGGGVMALLVAARLSQETQHVVTIASPIDLGAWVRHHDLTPLVGSLDPMDYHVILSRIPQTHVYGTQDENVPRRLSAFYEQKTKNKGNYIRFLEAESRDHQGDWPSYWPKILSQLTGSGGSRDQ